MSDTVTVTGLYIYPVKSLRGIAVNHHRLLPTGLEFDRRWMLVMPNGRFVTQRQMPKMATITTELTDESLVLSAAGHGSIKISKDAAENEDICDVTIWRDDCEATEAGAEVSAWLTAALESPKPLRLVRLRPDFSRPQSKPELMGPATTTHFADAAPYLVVNQASIDQLNRELLDRGLAQVDHRRFRPNILVTGPAPFAEHSSAGLSEIDGRYRLKHCYPCERCIMTTIDQDHGTRDPDMQPFKTLIALNEMPGNPQAPAFGENTTLTEGSGNRIALGDRLHIVPAAAG
ncbi:MOSC domain-containing protein [Exilibacterium tricleocarpae]|uniref:MOSC domain-containing protein n=1 Tax=Exilibacterium tricleocarpae TaxID=2591008 RepID=A0A545U5G0_9GAMM|nr:MOSC N-terminal beta barrel domain-containing protein [Exilibacterium tricleocarpae]TQV84704.1 MOSC domain-containing protein [Exilibacterium tricleocarpae]